MKNLLLLIAALVAGKIFAIAPPLDDVCFPSGGCHVLVDIDSVTGHRTVISADQARHRVHSASTSDGLGKYGTSGMGVIGTIGEVTIPVIMADFSDQGFLSTTTIAKVEEWFNGENYTENGNVGSVRQYFIDQSGGMFRPTFKVLGISHTNRTVAYYGANENVENLSHDVTGGYNYSAFSRQSGLINYVPLCVIYYAGQGEHRGAGADKIWAKFVEYTSGYDYSSLFAQHFKSYLYINEANGKTMDGIGTACHELCHAFGLPDVYDTAKTGCRVPGNWSLMSSGNYLSDGHSPVDLCAYERSMLGWLNMKELTEAGNYRLAPSEAAFVRNSSNSREYYILENRSTSAKWTPSSMSGGLLVYHIDYDKSAWENKKINVDDNHPRMMFVAADNNYKNETLFDYHRDLYPYLKNDSLTPTSIPAMTAYTGDFRGKSIYSIKRDKRDITFDFKEKTIPVEPIVEKFYTNRQLDAPIQSLAELQSGQRYALYNPHFTAYIVYAPKYSETNVWTAEAQGDESHPLRTQDYAQPLDITSTFSAWEIKASGGQYVFQNEGSRLFLTTPGTSGSTACSWSRLEKGMKVSSSAPGLFNLTTSGADIDYLCAAPQLAEWPLSTWYASDEGCQWQIIPIEEKADGVEAIPTSDVKISNQMFDLQGRPVGAQLSQGLYIHRGRKYIQR